MTTTMNLDMTTLVVFDSRSSVPFYKQIYDGYRTAILAGRLRPGERLPSTRALAAELSISRLPVVNACGHAAGHAPLRRAVADYLRTSRAVHCEASEVLIVSGSQMALQICALALLGRGSTVCIEEPGYPGARDVLTGTGARIVPVPVDDEGIIVDGIGRKVRAVYVTPSHRYPLGMSMSPSRRLRLP